MPDKSPSLREAGRARLDQNYPTHNSKDGKMWYKSQVRAKVMYQDKANDVGYIVLDNSRSMTNRQTINASVFKYQRTRDAKKRSVILWGNKNRKGLIRLFLPLLKSYTAMLVTCRTTSKDKHGQWLINHIRPFYDQYPHIHNLMMDMAQSKDDAANELLHEMMMIFEQTVEWWVPGQNQHGVTIDFNAYIQVHFKYYVQRWFDNFVKRQGIISSGSEEFDEYSSQEDSHDAISAPDDSEGMSNKLNISWYLGDTCHEVFKPLSPEQRRVLVWKYLHNYSIPQIANQLYISKEEVELLISTAEQTVRGDNEGTSSR